MFVSETRANDFKTVTVRGDSMSPLLKDGEELKVILSYYKNKKIERGDIVIAVVASNKTPIVKKVMAIERDRFLIKARSGRCEIIVNGKTLKNSKDQIYSLPQRACRLLKLYSNDYKNIIPRNSFLLLGDKINGSKDSTQFGLIDKKNIVGKVIR